LAAEEGYKDVAELLRQHGGQDTTTSDTTSTNVPAVATNSENGMFIQDTQTASPSQMNIKDLIPEQLYLLETQSRVEILGNASPGSDIIKTSGEFEILLSSQIGAFKTSGTGEQYTYIPKDVQVSDGKIAPKPNALIMLSFNLGAEHIYMAKTTLDQYVFDSDPKYPLVFRVGTKDEGYVYCFGRGTVTNTKTGRVTRLGQEQTLESWLPQLRSTSVRVRQYAASAVGYLGDDRNVPALIELIDDSSAAVRRNAVESLGRVPLSDANRAALINCCKGNDSAIASVALKSLARHGDASVPTLMEFVRDEKIRVNATLALGIARSTTAEGHLRELVVDVSQSNDVRAAAATALGVFADQPAVDALLSATEDKNKDIRINAIRSLAGIGSKTSLTRFDQIAENDPDDDVRKAASEAAASLRKPPTTGASIKQTIK
jgi:hypothetical protein